MMLKKINSSINEQFEKAKEMADVASHKFSDIKEAGSEKIRGYMDELANGLPLIEQAGFHMDGINIELGIPPDISIAFSKTNHVSDENIEMIIEANKEKKLLCMVLNALLNANQLQSKVTMNKFMFTGVGIAIGLPPKVSLRYSNKEQPVRE